MKLFPGIIFAGILLLAVSAVKVKRLKAGFKSKENLPQVYVGLDLVTNQYFYDTAPVAGQSYAAIGQLSEDTNSTGWAYLEVTNNISIVIPGAPMPLVNDSVRAYTAGLVEGYLTKHMINLHYLNTLDGYCDKDPAYCQRLNDFIDQNIEWINKLVHRRTDHSVLSIFINRMVNFYRTNVAFWHHTGLWLEQLSGIADGASMNFLGPRTDLSHGAKVLYMMNLDGDLGDLEVVLNLDKKFRIERGGCSAMVKITPNNELIASHDTWARFQAMLRVIKLHDLKYGEVHQNVVDKLPTFVTAAVKYSSYPAYLTSLDDFYVTSNQMAVFETTIENYNTSLWQYVKPIGSVVTAIRGVVATRLANSGAEWVQIASMFNSGTYNNEWIVVDYKAWERKAASGVLTVTDFMPGFVTPQDYTASLYQKSYFASYNIPSMPSVFELSNTTGQFKTWGSYFSYTNCSRALIFARNHSLATDVTSAMALMRYNNFQNDPLSRCEGCNPPYSAELAIAARSDLNLRNGQYPLSMLTWRMHGALDTKMTTSDLIGKLEFMAISGPTYDQQSPFQWSSSGTVMTDFPHYGHPDVFKFPAVVYE